VLLILFIKGVLFVAENLLSFIVYSINAKIIYNFSTRSSVGNLNFTPWILEDSLNIDLPNKSKFDFSTSKLSLSFRAY